jgi:hypothetical protein
MFICTADRTENARFCRCGGDVSGAEAVLVAVPGGSVADALDTVTGIESKTVIDATNLAGPRRRTALPPTPSTSSRGPQARRADVSEPVDRAGLAFMVAAWRWHERAVGTSAPRASGPQVAPVRVPGPGDTGQPPDPGSGVRVGICVRDLKFWIHPAFPVLF